MEEKECIGHVQKRMGTRLRILRQLMKLNILSDVGKIMGKGRLTGKAVNTLQNHYGTAIRQNLNSIYEMKKSIWATLFHNSNIIDETERHQFCHRCINRWCMWQPNELTGKSNYKAKLNLPLTIKEILKPLFQDLNRLELLFKLFAWAQNNNEAINNFIWKKCPKANDLS